MENHQKCKNALKNQQRSENGTLKNTNSSPKSAVREKQWDTISDQTSRKQITNDKDKSNHTHNYFECKWSKYPNQ